MSSEILSQGSSFSELCGRAWHSLSGKWGIAVGAFFVANLLLAAASQFLGWLGQLLLAPLTFGAALIALRIIRGGDAPDLAVLFEPFSQYGRCVWGVLRPAIFIFLWTLLLIIPGIIAGIRYSQTVYILLDRPDLSVKESMEESCRIMYGHKLQFFGISLLFALMVIPVAIFTLCIGLLWLIPWLGVFWAAFYESVKRPAVVTGMESFAELEAAAGPDAAQPESEPEENPAGTDPQA